MKTKEQILDDVMGSFVESMMSREDIYEAMDDYAEIFLSWIQGKYSPTSQSGIWHIDGRTGWLKNDDILRHFEKFPSLTADEYFEQHVKNKP